MGSRLCKRRDVPARVLLLRTHAAARSLARWVGCLLSIHFLHSTGGQRPLFTVCGRSLYYFELIANKRGRQRACPGAERARRRGSRPAAPADLPRRGGIHGARDERGLSFVLLIWHGTQCCAFRWLFLDASCERSPVGAWWGVVQVSHFLPVEVCMTSDEEALCLWGSCWLPVVVVVVVVVAATGRSCAVVCCAMWAMLSVCFIVCRRGSFVDVRRIM